MRGEDEMIDEEIAVRLLHPLREEPPDPSEVDVPRTMAEGRRRRRLRRWSAGVSLAAATALAAGGGTAAVSALSREPAPRPAPKRSAPVAVPTAAAPVGPTGCTVIRLPTAGIAKALVTGGDPSGRYLAGRLYPTSGSGKRTVIWKDGAVAAYPALAGSDASFEDLNTSGVAVGSSYDTQGRQYAYVYRAGTVIKLGGGEADAVAINDAGVIVGSLGPALAELPARWSSAGAAPARLPMPAGITTGAASGIAEDGTIVGSVARSDKEPSGYLWLPDGTGRAMPLPTVDGRKANYFWPESISGGWVAGRAVFDSGGVRSFASMRYRITTNSYEHLPVEMGPPALAAPNGWVAGVVGTTPTIVAGSTVVKLPTYGQQQEYILSTFSTDGRLAAGYSVDDAANAVGNLPLLWKCRR